jgi:hypothetical protein
VPAALAHSESGAKQWVSDELTRRAGRLATFSRKENSAWLSLVGRQALYGAWWLLVVVLVIDLATLALSGGWTLPRTATPLAFLAFAALFSLLSAVHYELGGVLCFLVGIDGRLSLPRAMGLLWAATFFTAFVYFGVEDMSSDSPGERQAVAAAISHPQWVYLALLAAPVLVSLLTGAVSGARMRRRSTPYLPGQRSQLRDLLIDESGLGSLAAAVWLPANLAAVLFLVVGLAKNPYSLPELPVAVVWLSASQSWSRWCGYAPLANWTARSGRATRSRYAAWASSRPVPPNRTSWPGSWSSSARSISTCPWSRTWTAAS